MAFDLNRFRQEAPLIKPRTATLDLPSLQYWFGEDTEPKWTVRALNGVEIAIADDVKGRAKLFLAAAEAISEASYSSQLDAFKALFQTKDNPPAAYIKKLDYLTFCSVDPQISREDAVYLFAIHPLEAYTIAATIEEITKMGPELGKAQNSTNAPMS